MFQADLIVVGAGTAGCVLAARLARESRLRITLVEPASPEAEKIDRERPSRWLNLLGSSDDWDLRTDSSAGLANRTLALPRGRGLGGSSRINAMIWFPPTNHDLCGLVDASGGVWSRESLDAAYQSTEALVAPEQPIWLSEVSHRFMQGVTGLANATPMIYRRTCRGGRRWTPANLLEPRAQDKQQVKILRATVDRLLWDKDRAIGVRLTDGSSARELLASKGVVICAGTIVTPAILMRSGVGPREELARHRIEVRIESPGVGTNLQDHLTMPVIFQTKSSDSFSAQVSLRDIVRWQVFGGGPVGSNIAECGGLFDQDAIQIHVTPTNYLTFPKQDGVSVMTLGVNVTQPHSRGSVKLCSRSPHQQPQIDANYLAAASDQVATIGAVRLARSIASIPVLAESIARELLPGPKRQSDASIAKSIARYAQTLYHPVGTCRMGCQTDCVVDSEFAVRGAEQLWIADASVLPKLTLGNPSATVMMLATLAAERVQRKVEQR